jgi:hypothetical protein
VPLFVDLRRNLQSIPLQTAYCASKHGIDGFLGALRVEFQHDKTPVSLTNVMPARINTPLFDNVRTKLGVKPVAPPPVYHPNIVADAIIHAAEHPVRDLVVGGAAKAMILTEALAPVCWMPSCAGSATGCTIRKTKPEKAPDNLFHPLPEHDTVEGTVGDHALQWSLYTWLELHPGLKRAASIAVTAAAVTALHAASR